MLLNRAQFNRFIKSFKPGQFTTMGGVPANIHERPTWTSSMNNIAYKKVEILDVLISDPFVMTDGSIMYEPLLLVSEPLSGVKCKVRLDWLHNIVIDEILREPEPIQVNIKPKQKEIVHPAQTQSEAGWGWLAAGSLAALVGMSYLKKQKVKKQAQELVERTPDDFELDVEVVEEEEVQV